MAARCSYCWRQVEVYHWKRSRKYCEDCYVGLRIGTIADEPDKRTPHNPSTGTAIVPQSDK